MHRVMVCDTWNPVKNRSPPSPGGFVEDMGFPESDSVGSSRRLCKDLESVGKILVNM